MFYYGTTDRGNQKAPPHLCQIGLINAVKEWANMEPCGTPEVVCVIDLNIFVALK